ncbi:MULTISPECIES: VOC family protein [Actinomadura]|uniref:VOC family protein n=1 Tax=Actinomadura litoris TaxID=2678616 RepID=A0A7K1L3Y2_9ACTN|nr:MULTISPECIES: VOC family protein [Actinomadura]MBT2210044.1 VOC family protein [Actinomadura sp. NEAU-AAG7]MUN39131.1 VOC family protein [Actinomadura litoris]
MTITLNHTIVSAADNDEAARFFAGVMGLEYTGPHPHARHFVPIKVNDTLTLDYLTVAFPQGQHLAFDVDAATFDTVVGRLDDREIPYGDTPARPDNGRIDPAHPLGGRGVYFSDSSGNLYELISP